MPHSYEDALAHVEPAALKAPRDSAAVILLRRGRSGEIEVFWARRARSMRFMGGWHAFPGGGLSPEDAESPLQGVPRGCDQASSPALTPGWRGDKASAEFSALAACALRELSEDTGFDVAGASRLVYAGRWITGILWLLTGGLLWVGQLIDLFLIPGMIRQSNLEGQLLAQVQVPGRPATVAGVAS